MTRRLTLSLAALVAAGTLGIASPSHAADHYLLAPAGTCADDNNTAATVEAQRGAMYCLMNHARTRSGRPALNYCLRSNSCRGTQLFPMETRKLLFSADAKATDVRNCYSPNSDPHKACGRDMGYWLGYYGYAFRWSENITLGAPWTAREGMNWWLHSTPHRDAILDPATTEVGVGMAAGSTAWGAGQFWVAHFGKA